MTGFVVKCRAGSFLLGPDLKDQEFGPEAWHFVTASEAKIYCSAARAAGFKAEVRRVELEAT